MINSGEREGKDRNRGCLDYEKRSFWMALKREIGSKGTKVRAWMGEEKENF